MRMPSGVVKSTETPGTFFQSLAHGRVEIVECAPAILLEHNEHVRERMRHRVLGAFGASGAPDDVVDVGELAQNVFGAMVEAIDFLERGLGRAEARFAAGRRQQRLEVL